MKIHRLQVNHMTTPLGFDTQRPTFSFQIEKSTGKKLSGARIRVARTPDMKDVIYDSGMREDISSLAFTPDCTFEGGVRYYWDVTAQADDGDTGVSAPSWFEGGLSGAWDAPFITTPYEDKRKHPVFERAFTLEGKAVAQARLYICGLGVYEAYVNGSKAGDEYLAPFYNDYRFALQYQTYDVTDALRAGENTLRVMLGEGWYKGRFTYVGGGAPHDLFGDRYLLTAQLKVVYADGTEQCVSTDEGWQCFPSAVLSSGIYDGEVYDARLEGAHEAPVAAEIAQAPEAPMTPRFSVPLRAHERFTPTLIMTPAGEQVLDFGQEISGWVEFDCDAPEGTRVYMQYGEILQEGNFYRDNLRSALAEYTYISGGQKAHVRPHFTFYGFRYVKVTGLSITQENLADYRFEAVTLYSDIERTGFIETSNKKVNRMIENTLWGQKGNFVDVPTDCPQRDERLGWTGDAQVFCATASYHMATAAFYRKYLFDMRREQRRLQGSVPHVVPDCLGLVREKSGRPVSDPAKQDWGEAGSCAWGDAATVIPSALYTFFGDKALLEETYDNMKQWTDYIIAMDETHCGGQRLWRCGFHFADWLALDNPDAGSSFGRTDPYYVASAYYLYSVRLTAQAARILNRAEDAAYYEKIASEVLEAIRNEYVTPTGRVAIDTQTALVLALAFDLLKEEHRDRAARDLHAMLASRGMHLATGFVGTAYLCRTLTKVGLAQDAYTLLLNEDYPSWLYEVNMGATTIWERWNSVLPDGSISDTGMNSLNHYAYGAVAEWIYADVCGLAPAPGSAGFDRIVFAPHPDERLEWIKASYISASGKYESAWRWEEGRVCVQLTVPFGARAQLRVPEGFTLVTVNGGAGRDGMTLEKGEHTLVLKRK